MNSTTRSDTGIPLSQQWPVISTRDRRWRSGRHLSNRTSRAAPPSGGQSTKEPDCRPQQASPIFAQPRIRREGTGRHTDTQCGKSVMPRQEQEAPRFLPCSFRMDFFPVSVTFSFNSCRSLGRENNEAVDADDGHRKHQKASNKRRVVEPSDPEFQDPGGVNP